VSLHLAESKKRGTLVFGWLLKLLGFKGVSAPVSIFEAPVRASEKSSSPPLVAVNVVEEYSDGPTEHIRSAVYQEELPSTEDLFRPDDFEPPWDCGDTAVSMELKEVRTDLREQLSAMLERVDTKGDRKFLLRMARLVDSEQLELPPFPDVAQELDDLLKDKNTSLVQIAKIVEKDAGLVKRVWTTASSAAFASPPRSLHHAVSRIGLDALWRIGMSVCVNDNVFRVTGFQEVADQVRTHGVVTAEVAAYISRERRGSVYMAGLLHDVGKLIAYRTAVARRGAVPPSE